MKKKDLIDKIIIYIIMLVCIEPVYLTNITAVKMVFYAIKILAVSILMLKAIFLRKVSKINIYVFVFLAINLISNIKNNRSISFLLSRYINWIIIMLFVDEMIKKNYKNFFQSSAEIFSAFILINFISVILKPVNSLDVDVRTHFLGYDNDSVPIIIIGMFMVMINSEIKKNKLTFSTIFICLIAIISSVLVWSANGIIGVFLIQLYCLFQILYLLLNFYFQTP